MTSLWPICFSLWFAGVLGATQVAGRIELRDIRTPGRGAADLSGVVVALEPVDATGPLPVRTGRILQKSKTFTPHVLAITVGSSVEFPNLDPFFHNAFSNYDGQVFDVGLYPPGTTRTVKFRRAGVVRVFCNIHASMSAVIVVLATPYYAVSGPDGTYQIENVPPGDYRLTVFHERATPGVLAGLARRVTVGDAPLALPGLTISEAGYLAIPHKNKYGHEYGAESGVPLYPNTPEKK